MAGSSRIEWTESTWNPVTGCTKISPAASTATRSAWPSDSTRWGGATTATASRHGSAADAGAAAPVGRSRRLIFVNSMSDLFHDDCAGRIHPARVRRHARRATHASRFSRSALSALPSWSPNSSGPLNIWMGVSVENAKYARGSPTSGVLGAHRFLSLEPLLGPLRRTSTLGGIHWVIVGRRVRAEGPPDPQAGCSNPRPVRGGAGAVLLQAVGKGSVQRRPDGSNGDQGPPEIRQGRLPTRRQGVPATTGAALGLIRAAGGCALTSISC